MSQQYLYRGEIAKFGKDINLDGICRQYESYLRIQLQESGTRVELVGKRVLSQTPAGLDAHAHIAMPRKAAIRYNKPQKVQ